MRITKKRKDGFYELKMGQEIFGEENGIRLVQIVGQFEDIEDGLGIDLITLFKILKAKECYTKKDGKCYIVGIDKNGVILMRKGFAFGECEFTVPFNELGKTWALTKGELKK